MLVLIAAFCFIVIVLLLFGLAYVRLIGSSSEQRTAIEAAAIAAARDLSTIVINTPEFGFVGLSDSAPNGSSTVAGDSFDTTTHSINTLIGTARLDMIIAQNLGVPEMQELALNDLTAAKTEANNLIAVLDAAILPGGSGTDKNGNTVTPYVSAETAYQQNQIRMTGSSSYVTGSMRLTLGAIQNGIATNIPVPKPAGIDGSLNTTNTINNCYRSYMDIPFNGQDFVFAGIGANVKLVDPRMWVAAPTGLPYFHRTILKAEADQIVNDPTHTSQTIHAIACAQPASVYDPRPAPGALQISFPDGPPNNPDPNVSPATPLYKPYDLYAAPMNDPTNATTDYFMSNGGDYPVAAASNIVIDTPEWPVASDTQHMASTACKIAVYDWLRRGGTKVDVNSVVGMHNTPFDPAGPWTPWGSPSVGNIPSGISHIYRFDPDGVVTYESKTQSPQPYYVVADQQIYMTCFDVLFNGATAFDLGQPPAITLGPPLSCTDGIIEFEPTFDMFVRCYTRKPGTTTGGLHAGEPLDNPLVVMAPADVKLSENLTSGTASVETMVVTGKGALPGGYMKGWGMKGKGKGGTVTLSAGTIGAPPTIVGREDFMESAPSTIDRTPSWYQQYATFSGSALRTTYMTNGTVSDIRFRRVLGLWSNATGTPVESGYVGIH